MTSIPVRKRQGMWKPLHGSPAVSVCTKIKVYIFLCLCILGCKMAGPTACSAYAYPTGLFQNSKWSSMCIFLDSVCMNVSFGISSLLLMCGTWNFLACQRGEGQRANVGSGRGAGVHPWEENLQAKSESRAAVKHRCSKPEACLTLSFHPGREWWLGGKAVTFCLECLESRFVLGVLPATGPSASLLPLIFPPFLARAGHLASVLLGGPSFPHLYLNISFPSYENLRIYLQSTFQLTSLSTPPSSLLICFWLASCNKSLIWWAWYSPPTKRWAEVRAGCRNIPYCSATHSLESREFPKKSGNGRGAILWGIWQQEKKAWNNSFPWGNLEDRVAQRHLRPEV